MGSAGGVRLRGRSDFLDQGTADHRGRIPSGRKLARFTNRRTFIETLLGYGTSLESSATDGRDCSFGMAL